MVKVGLEGDTAWVRRCAHTLSALALTCAALSPSPARAATTYPAPLPADGEPHVLSLPAQYPRGWALLAFANDKFEILDVGSDERSVKGQLPGHESATALLASHRPEIYVADTVWARGNRGARTDYITVYDKKTLAVAGEIVLPGAKRALVVPMQGMFSLSADEKFAFVFNFTPAQSVTVVNLEQRKVAGEIAIPGCSLAYSSGTRGFSSLCANGTLLAVQIDERGVFRSKSESQPFNKLDTDPLFTNSALIGGVRYFPSIQGHVQPIDLSSDEPKVLPDWPLVSPDEAKADWRPSGLQLAAAGDDGKLYVIMQPDAHEGSHKDAGTEVWVFETKSRTRVNRLRLVRAGTSITVTHDQRPLLLVSTETQLDVYGLPEGNLIRSLDAASRRGGVLMEAMK